MKLRQLTPIGVLTDFSFSEEIDFKELMVLGKCENNSGYIITRYSGKAGGFKYISSNYEDVTTRYSIRFDSFELLFDTRYPVYLIH